MKILIIANNGGGLYRFRKELIIELLKDNVVYIALPHDEDVENLIGLGCRYIGTEFDRHGTNPLSEMKLQSNYRSIIANIGPDVVFTYTVKPNVYAGAVCASLGVPYITNITGLGGAIENGGLMQRITLLLYKRGLRKAQTVFFQNKDNLSFMKGKGVLSGNYDLLPGSGVNLKEYSFEEYPKDEGILVFNVIGRIMKDKGIDEILELGQFVHEKYPNVKIRLIGGFDGDYEEKVKNASENGWIEYCGFQPSIHEFIKNSHATIHASYHEGMSNVLLETAATGRPVIASNIPGCRETFNDGVSGIAFQPQNGKSLIDAVEKFILLPYDTKAQMGMEGRKKVEREFDRELVISKYREELKKIGE